MLLSPPESLCAALLRRGQFPRSARKIRAGFTLIEMMISMSILSFAAAVFGGLMLAISAAWDHSTALEDSRRQAQTSLSRIKWMIQQSGTYRISGRSTQLGLAVISTSWGSYQAPTGLVVWSGGTNGGMNSQGLQSRLPKASELVVYVPDTNPSRLVEVTFPGSSIDVDFQASSFVGTVQSLMASASRRTILLCDRLHATTASGSSSSTGNIRFELMASPTDSQISAVALGSQGWNDLPWGQGLVSADGGLRTANVRIELLLDPDPNKITTDNGYSTAVPFLGSANRQYVFQR